MVIFLLDFECGDRAAVAGEVEKACWDGRRRDRERKALPEGRKGINFVAMMKLAPLHRMVRLSSVGEESIRTEKLLCDDSSKSAPKIGATFPAFGLSSQRLTASPGCGFRDLGPKTPSTCWDNTMKHCWHEMAGLSPYYIRLYGYCVRLWQCWCLPRFASLPNLEICPDLCSDLVDAPQ